jgi:hypothetical protein
MKVPACGGRNAFSKADPIVQKLTVELTTVRRIFTIFVRIDTLVSAMTVGDFVVAWTVQ